MIPDDNKELFKDLGKIKAATIAALCISIMALWIVVLAFTWILR